MCWLTLALLMRKWCLVSISVVGIVIGEIVVKLDNSWIARGQKRIAHSHSQIVEVKFYLLLWPCDPLMIMIRFNSYFSSDKFSPWCVTLHYYYLLNQAPCLLHSIQRGGEIKCTVCEAPSIARPLSHVWQEIMCSVKPQDGGILKIKGPRTR